MNKSRFLAFILAFIPGCGLMYLGYMKKGLQIMAMFAASGYIAFLADQIFFDWIMVFFILMMPVIWFYQMFDAMHSLTRMKKESIETPVDDGFFMPENLRFSPFNNRAVSKGIAIVLILMGVIGIIYGALGNLHHFLDWGISNMITRIVRTYLTPVIVSIALIIAGVRLLKGSKDKNSAHDDKGSESL